MGNDRAAVMLTDVARAAAAHSPVELYGQDVAVSDVHMDSRSVTPGSLYVAIRGARADGHRFITGAMERGAVAAAVSTAPTEDLPHLLVPDTRQALGWLAAAVHGDPAGSLSLIGITGTNGKTTVAHMLAAMTERVMAVIGTVSANLDDLDVSPRTTPEASDLQRILRQIADAGRITDVAVEVSSHAMEMGRVNGTRFDVVAFTNLSQDHLDYHLTMEAYFQAKARLFSAEWAPKAVIWTDDPWGRRLADEVTIPVVTVGTEPACDVRVTYGADTPSGSSFSVVIGGQTRSVATALAGRFNVANAAIALACADQQGWDLDHAVAGLAGMRPIPGRYNTIDNDREIWIVVDYAHTPDAIAGVIAETRPLVAGRVIAVGGAGGDRDREKRPLMGGALSTADIALVTTDNPRSEDPVLILDQVMAGTNQHALLEPDRRTAIRRALAMAQPGDAVLILGKGHEPVQEFADHEIPFDDAAVARAEVAALGGGS
ncbi:MAG: UDP-N-acetylmuramoyl-L-alanyl-D-glutamate--2,6-diaminopimelate ligase [Acidimicrobiia bacterium]|nr:UDP-N-acetylmuramoyl-L-alanyl-D-glutamate--2,6-diaminopimelate ligase [Acidimicrobiia bacterium]